MRGSCLLIALILIGLTLAHPAKADSQCAALGVAAYEGDASRMSALIASGVNVNCSYTGSFVEESTGNTVTYTSTPLNEAAYAARLKPVQVLLSHGANVNIRDGYGHTPLYNVDMALEEIFYLGTEDEYNEADAVFSLLKQAGGVFE